MWFKDKIRALLSFPRFSLSWSYAQWLDGCDFLKKYFMADNFNHMWITYLFSLQNQLIYLYRYWLFKDDCKKYKNLGWKAFSFFNTFRQNVFANSKIYIIFRPVCSDGLGRTLLPTQPLLPTSHFGLCKRTKPGGMEMKETQLKIEWEAPELAIVHYCK